MAESSIGMQDEYQNRPVIKTISAIVLFVYTTVVASPGAQAIEQAVQQQVAESRIQHKERDNLHAQSLKDVKSHLQALKALSGKKSAKLSDLKEERAALHDLRQQLKDRDVEAMAEFDAIETHIKTNHLPDEILRRHEDAVAKFKAESTATQSDLDSIDRATDLGVIKERVAHLHDRLMTFQVGPKHQAFDPKHMAFHRSENKNRSPRTRTEEFTTLFDVATDKNQLLASLNPAMQLSSVSSNPDYLAATEDVQITQEIKDLAVALSNDPVQIYNWVYNNIQSVPTFGSIQGSDLTLHNGQGNAFDTSSLLISLLRAAGIPSRYAYGTVEIPAADAMNWVGGVSTIDQAQELLGQGGVPVVAVTQGGSVKALRFEHVWVEAYVDFSPSRGAKNSVPDTWVPMDATFKHYNFEKGIDFKTVVPFDGKAAMAQLRSNSLIDDSKGIISSIDLTQAKSIYTTYKTRIKDYLAQNRPDATVVDMLDAQRIIQRVSPVLAASLPYRKIAAGPVFASLPSSLRYSLTISLYASPTDQSLESSQLETTISLPIAALHRISVTHTPASQADADVIKSAIDAGSTSLPAYLIRVIPQLKLDDAVLASAPASTMGTQQIWQVRFSGPGEAGSPVSFTDKVAGDELVFSVDGNGINGNAAVNQLIASQKSAIENLHFASLTYWTAHDWFDRFISSAFKVRTVRLPSVALAGSGFTPRYFFGIPRSASFLGQVFDARRVYVAAVAPTAALRRGFLIQAGTQGSQFEASAFNSVYGRPQGTALSAAEYLHYAVLRGVPIYSITPENAAAVLPSLAVSDDVRNDISTAIANGKVVVTAGRSVLARTTSGIGYIILDPVTGEGAYLIDGGLNGSVMPCCQPQASNGGGGFVDPVTALVLGGTVAARNAASKEIATEVTEQLAAQGAESLAPKIIETETVEVIGTEITIGLGEAILLGVLAAVLVTLIIIFIISAIALAMELAEMERGDDTRTKTDELDCNCKPDPKPIECLCKFTTGPQLGNDPIHDQCANLHTSTPNLEFCITHVELGSWCYDTINGKTVGEVKTYNCTRKGGFCDNPYAQLSVSNNLYQQKLIAEGCGYSFEMYVGDRRLADLFRKWGLPTTLDESGSCIQPLSR